MKKSIILFFCYALTLGKSFGQDRSDTSEYIKGHKGIYAILISKHDRTIKSSFYNNYNKDSLFNDQSLTKNICSLLIGIAIDQRFINSVDEKISTFFPDLKTDSDKRKQEITIRQLMNQASGLYHENLQRTDLYLNTSDPTGLVTQSPLTNDPGKIWHYNNAASHLLSVIITKATGMDTKTFAGKYLFTPLSITKIEWAKMRDGYYDGSGLLSIRMRAQDMLKIGVMISNGGRYHNHQVVPANWIQQILAPSINYKATWGFENSEYGLCWYHARYKGTAFTYGMGWGGQFILLIPSLRAVIVINENTADQGAIMQSDNFITHIFPLLFEELKN